MHNHHVLGKGFCSKTNRIFYVTIASRGDNDEGLSSITISSTFDKVSKRMSWYEYVYVGAVHKSFQ